MRKTLIGKVTGDRNAKTRRVDVERRFRHPKYGKIVRGRTVCQVHDENNESKIGDTVEISESRPHSKTKRWELVRVVKSVAELESRLKREETPTEVTEEVAEVAAEQNDAPEASESDS